MKYKVKLSKAGYSELMQLRGNPDPKDPNSHITRNRGGLSNISREYRTCDSDDVDIVAIQNDMIVRVNGDTVEEIPWFEVVSMGENKPLYEDVPDVTSAELIEQAEIELEEDAEIEAEVAEIVSTQCIAKTASGKRCSRTAKEGSQYCGIHQPKDE